MLGLRRGAGRARGACEPDRVASGLLGCCASRAEREMENKSWAGQKGKGGEGDAAGPLGWRRGKGRWAIGRLGCYLDLGWGELRFGLGLLFSISGFSFSFLFLKLTQI